MFELRYKILGLAIEVDYDWLCRNLLAFKEYAGKYVAIIGRRIVGVGESAEEAFKAASENEGGKTPAIGYVRKGDGGLHLLTGQAGG
jgi:hypothetical protein